MATTAHPTAAWNPRGPSLVTSLIAGSLFAVVFTAFGAFNMFNGESAEWDGQGFVNWGVCIAGIAVAALIAWRASVGAWTRGDARGLGVRALIFGALALLSLPVFWLGVYGPFAAAALVMGARALTSSGAGRGTQILAAAGIVLALLGTFVCALNNVIG